MRRRFFVVLVAICVFCWLAVDIGEAQPRPQVFTLHSAEAGAAANGTALSTFGYPTVTVDNSIAAAWDGTLNYEAEYPSIGYVVAQCVNQATNLLITTTTGAASVRCNITGAQRFRARVSGRTVGTVTATAALMAGGDSSVGAVTISDTLVDDAAFGIATSRVFPAGYLFDDVAPDSVNEGDIGGPRMSANRVPYAQLRDAAGNERGVNVNASNALLVVQTGELPAGTQNIGDVDVVSVVPGTAATNLGKAEDAGHTTGDVGVMVLAVRNDVRGTLAGTDIDYAPLQLNTSGDLRVDGSAVTQPVSGTVTANQGTANATPWNENVAQFGGTNISTGTGAGGAGIPRVTISNDSSLAANQAVNVSQINGVTPLMGNGNTGTGSHRVTTADNDPCQTSGRTKSAVVVAVTDDAQLVALSGSTIIYVCGFSVTVTGTTPTFRLISGTGTVCATGLTGRTGAYAPLPGTYMQGGGGSATLLATAAGEALCIDVEGTSPSVQGVLTYIRQ